MKGELLSEFLNQLWDAAGICERHIVLNVDKGASFLEAPLSFYYQVESELSNLAIVRIMRKNP